MDGLSCLFIGVLFSSSETSLDFLSLQPRPSQELCLKRVLLHLLRAGNPFLSAPPPVAMVIIKASLMRAEPRSMAQSPGAGPGGAGGGASRSHSRRSRAQTTWAAPGRGRLTSTVPCQVWACANQPWEHPHPATGNRFFRGWTGRVCSRHIFMAVLSVKRTLS